MRRLALTVTLVVTTLIATPVDAGRRRRGDNLPRGFRWPPSPAMQAAGRRCLADLDALGVGWRRGPATPRVATPIELTDMAFGPVALSPTFRAGPFVMDCDLARGLARKAIDLAALGVVELRFSTIHEYRQIRVRGRRGRAPLSRHALGLAIDVFELGLADGRRLVVARDYHDEPVIQAIEALFRRDPDFRGPLSPGNAPRSHRDHLHLEARQGDHERAPGV